MRDLAVVAGAERLGLRGDAVIAHRNVVEAVMPCSVSKKGLCVIEEPGLQLQPHGSAAHACVSVACKYEPRDASKPF